MSCLEVFRRTLLPLFVRRTRSPHRPALATPIDLFARLTVTVDPSWNYYYPTLHRDVRGVVRRGAVAPVKIRNSRSLSLPLHQLIEGHRHIRERPTPAEAHEEDRHQRDDRVEPAHPFRLLNARTVLLSRLKL